MGGINMIVLFLTNLFTSYLTMDPSTDKTLSPTPKNTLILPLYEPSLLEQKPLPSLKIAFNHW
jgi:hypothetical protein